MNRSAEWVPSLWKETFEELLDEDNELDYGDQWNINFSYTQENTLTQNEKKKGWKIFSPCSFGSFSCASCSKSWRSAKVTLLFRYRLRGERGAVIMRPFGQACRSCQDDSFVRPGFSKEDVENVLLGLCSKIRKNCYGEQDDNAGGREPQEFVKKTKPHESDLCEACSQGICCLKEE
ncbi:receptor-transporting protein 3-like [Eleginops maclovinus]|uniref:receptor-transporting protein 3-like n=1 Tax=Eleginops maclovinus TaxID=56733 RepID=UPI003080685B